MMTNDEIIAVVQAHKDGKKIQFYCNTVERWENLTSPCWDFHSWTYRTKPEKKVGYLNIYPDTGVCLFATKEKADRNSSNNRAACIRVEYFKGQFDEDSE